MAAVTGWAWSVVASVPSPEPSLRPGLDPLDVSPGLAGFLAVFAIALASVLLFRSMTSKIRGVKRRDTDDDGGGGGPESPASP